MSAGLLGLLVDGAARVRLHAPPPLDTPMDVVRVGAGLEARTGEHTVLSAAPAELDVSVPNVTQDEAERSSAPFIGHTAVTCFVCGPESPQGLYLLPGPVGDGPTNATVWTPEPWAGSSDGVVEDEIVWGALDCPGALAASRAYPDDRFFPALGTMTARIDRPVLVGETYTVIAWPTGRDGRKLFAGTALADADGEVVAVSDQTCIAMPVEWGKSR